MNHEIRVIFGDTDQMGVVYYANYLRYFESARAEYWRNLGRSYRELEAIGLGLPVVSAHCDYKRPAFYEDLLVVHVGVTELRPVSMRFEYTVSRGDTLLAAGFTKHAVVRAKDGRPVPLPDEFRSIIPVVAPILSAPNAL